MSEKKTTRKGNVIFAPISQWGTISGPDDFGSNLENIHLLNEQRYDDFWLQVEMSDGTWREIPAKIIAEHRANHYCNNVDGNFDDEIQMYSKVISETLSNEEVLIDWAESSVPWNVVSPFIREVKPRASTNFEDGWANGMKQLVDYGKD